MISINVNESKKLRFKVSLSGVQVQDLRGSMRIMLEGIEYGFPINIDKGDIVVDMSPLSEVYGRNIKDGSLLDAKLEVIAGDNYLLPWQDKIKINNPIKLEAKIEDIVEEIKDLVPRINISSVSEEETKKETPVVEKKEEVKESKKKKTKFSMMLEQPKCPEGEKY